MSILLRRVTSRLTRVGDLFERLPSQTIPVSKKPSLASTFSFATTAIMSESKLKYLIVLDFEATCSQSPTFPLKDQEIIEFPALLYSLQHNSLVEKLEGPHEHPPTFHEYVRPVLQPKLTEFCTQLTGIEQETVDAAEPFPAVWGRHCAWLQGIGAINDPDSFAYLTCGNWDMATALPKELARLPDVEIPVLCHKTRVINIKKDFSKHYNMKKDRGMGTFKLFCPFKTPLTLNNGLRSSWDVEILETSVGWSTSFRD